MSIIRHTGRVVADLKRQIFFYQALGFQLKEQKIEEGEYIETLLGRPYVVLEWAKLSDNWGHTLELLQYNYVPVHNCCLCHLALTVSDIDSTVDIVKQNGGKIINQPIKSPDGKVKVCYCVDPEDNYIELVEEVYELPESDL